MMFLITRGQASLHAAPDPGPNSNLFKIYHVWGIQFLRESQNQSNRAFQSKSQIQLGEKRIQALRVTEEYK